MLLVEQPHNRREALGRYHVAVCRAAHAKHALGVERTQQARLDVEGIPEHPGSRNAPANRPRDVAARAISARHERARTCTSDNAAASSMSWSSTASCAASPCSRSKASPSVQARSATPRLPASCSHALEPASAGEVPTTSMQSRDVRVLNRRQALLGCAMRSQRSTAASRRSSSPEPRLAPVQPRRCSTSARSTLQADVTVASPRFWGVPTRARSWRS